MAFSPTAQHTESSVVKAPAMEQEAVRNLIDEFLAEQSNLSAVERFAQKMEHAQAPAQKALYRDLIPIEKPSSKQQYAFEVDLDACTGCKACVVACHSLNGLEQEESWRDVGLLVTGTSAAQRSSQAGSAESRQQHVTTACHHCLEPGCLEGCPVGAYEKIPSTGVVRHLDDQCIGCQYCSLKCPYDVPKYSSRLGIVRKCDMCHERLAEGEAPACVQSCPNQAIRIVNVDKKAARIQNAEAGQLVAGSFRSEYTQPTTRFVGQTGVSSTGTQGSTAPGALRPADQELIYAQASHTPLVTMLTLTQAAVGLHFIATLCAAMLGAQLSFSLMVLSCVLCQLGLLASLAHLGSPLGAWRFFLGLKTSWLSREILLFSLWFPALALHTLLSVPNSWLASALQGLMQLAPALSPDQASSVISWHQGLHDGPWLGALGFGAAALGLLSIYCSTMVYVDTKRWSWSWGHTSMQFFLTALLLGLAGSAALLPSWTALTSSENSAWIAPSPLFGVLYLAAVLVAAVLFTAQNRRLRYADYRGNELGDRERALLQSARVRTEVLRPTLTLHRVSAAVGLLLLGLGGLIPGLGVFGAVLLCLSQWLERRMFFQSVDRAKMPGQAARVPSTSH